MANIPAPGCEAGEKPGIKNHPECEIPCRFMSQLRTHRSPPVLISRTENTIPGMRDICARINDGGKDITVTSVDSTLGYSPWEALILAPF